MVRYRASRYLRYDSDRRSRSPRDRSPDRFDRASQYSDGDRRRSSAEARANASAFQSNRDVFSDQLRREPPRGPKALIDAPIGPRGGGYVGDFRGRGGRGRGRGWSVRDESRDRGRDRDIDFRDRYRDERSRERERERDRDRDWRDSRDFRARRSPIGRPRSPGREFRDRDRDLPLGVDPDRARRGSRDGGPPSAGSSSSDPQFGMSAFPRGGGLTRGRGRGGRGDWPSDRGRGRALYDDRIGDRYPRSRSQEGRWGRDRDERDRGDRYPELDQRRDPRDDRDRGDRELFRAKMESRASSVQEAAPQIKDVSPPPVAPSAPAFGSVPNRTPGSVEGHQAPAGAGKPPPTGPRSFGERPVSAGHLGGQESNPSNGSSKTAIVDPTGPQIPLGPRAQQLKQQRPSSKQWINPNLKKGPESPKGMRSQSFVQQRPALFYHDSIQANTSLDEKRHYPGEARDSRLTSPIDNRARSNHSAEPGEITVKHEMEEQEARDHANGEDRSFFSRRGNNVQPFPERSDLSPLPKAPMADPGERNDEAKGGPIRKRKHPSVGVVKFALPPKIQPQEQSESDDDEEMIEWFDKKMQDAEAELSKLQKPKSVPLQIVSRFATMSHGSMVKILQEREGVSSLIGIPDETANQQQQTKEGLAAEPPVAVETTVEAAVAGTANISKETSNAPASNVNETIATPVKTAEAATSLIEPIPEPEPKAEDMDLDEPSAPAPALPEKPLPIVEKPVVQEEAVGAATLPSPAPLSEEHPVPVVEEHPQPTVSIEVPEVESKPPSTPSQVGDEEDDDETESEDDAYVNVEQVRQYMATPPLDSLPDFGTRPWMTDRDLILSLDTDSLVDEFVAQHLNNFHLSHSAEQEREKKAYADRYLDYLDFTNSSDPVAVKSRDKFSVTAPVVERTGAITPESKPEGRGGGRRFATERDLERVLEASMREDEERKERESRMQKEKYRSDKEAVIPSMYWTEEEKERDHYIDRSGFVPQDRLVAAWHVLPPVNNFTAQETELFEKRYLELPKQWGKVAEAIPHRDFGTCIQYYYLMKKELNLKEKLKKQPKRRKKGGRGKQRSSALVSELGNGDAETEDNQETGENGERKRPRRAAAPTWGFEQPATDTDSATPTAASRRGPSAAAKVDQPDKVDGRKGRRKAAKDKEPKVPKPAQPLAAGPAPPNAKRSRSNSRAPNVEFQANIAPDLHRLPLPYEQAMPAGIQPPFPVQQQQPMQSMEQRPQSIPPTSISEVMAPPSLRPEPPQQPPQPAMTTFNLASQQIPLQNERKVQQQTSSYWSVSESNDFPQLLRAFGSDWLAIATHMGSKTAIMVCF